jgi:hypothetical protein
MYKVLRLSLYVLLLALFSVHSLQAKQEQKNTDTRIASINFNGTAFLYRWSQAGQYEFTPAGQEDLDSWTEMITLWLYPSVTDDDSLTAQAANILNKYKISGGKILHTYSVPRVDEKPAEHFIAAMLGGNVKGKFIIEFAAARFLLLSGKGVGMIYSRRSYGEQAPQVIGSWVVQNGETMEKTVMAFNPAEVVSSLRK